MSIELRRSRRNRISRRRRMRRRGPGYRPLPNSDQEGRAISAAAEALPTGWGDAPVGWLLEALGFYGLDAVEEGLLIALVTGEPILLVGRHGTAKTAICCRLGDVLGLRFHAYDAAKALFEDVVGFPNPSSLAKGEVSYVPTPMSLWDKEFILVDELSRAQPQMQNKWLEVIRSHRLMGRALPRLRYVMAAMNPTDYLGAVPLDEALLSRFAIVLKMPEVAEMGEGTARLVIAARSEDDAPLIGKALSGAPGDGDDLARIRRRLRRRLTVARRQLPTVEAIFGHAVIGYVHEVSLHLTERGHGLDARRLGMVRRNLLVALALEAGERNIDASILHRREAERVNDPKEPAPHGSTPIAAFGVLPEDLSSIVGRTLSASLPFVADGQTGPSADMLGTIHRAAFEQAFDVGESMATDTRGRSTNIAVNCSGRRQLVAYQHAIGDLPIEEHYRVANDLLQRAQEAPTERLVQAWDGLLALSGVVREHADSVPWEVTEHLLDGLAVRFGIAESPAAGVVALAHDEQVDAQRAGPARLARQCLAHVTLKRRGDHQAAARLLNRLREQVGVR